MTLFRPCIDLHEGRVKQIVGGSLGAEQGPKTNFVAEQDATYFAELYRRDNLTGGHVIKLGPGNDAAARAALEVWPRGLQLGGGVTAENARDWLDHGASKVIVTSWLFEDGKLSASRLSTLARTVSPAELVIDLSCRRRGQEWYVATDRWQTLTDTKIEPQTLAQLARYASEFLVHAVDVEGLCRGIDGELVELLGRISPLPCTYAGGANDLGDLDRVAELGRGRVDLTYGSALDIFGGTLVKYSACVAYNRAHGGSD